MPGLQFELKPRRIRPESSGVDLHLAREKPNPNLQDLIFDLNISEKIGGNLKISLSQVDWEILYTLVSSVTINLHRRLHSWKMLQHCEERTVGEAQRGREETQGWGEVTLT
ncbi:unnamed protein product [Microthlaspi erraticum]|uniref:Uncharacterized protein n=1 Tax=Microthlaspi erraticum TaxID=1685480 RepID=A0A6D2IVS5_9BRAS|nr:unnamed protein product [Microthlaspi erraticum]